MPLIDVGKKAPAFTLPDQHGKRHALREYLGRPVVIYFYPKDNTPGCTKEACAFRDALPAFKEGRAVILGISPDSAASHARFADQHALNFTLLADAPAPDGAPKVCARYGVWREKSLAGRKYMGVVRTTYLIDVNGKVARRWDKVKVAGHAEAVMEAVREL